MLEVLLSPSLNSEKRGSGRANDLSKSQAKQKSQGLLNLVARAPLWATLGFKWLLKKKHWTAEKQPFLGPGVSKPPQCAEPQLGAKCCLRCVWYLRITSVWGFTVWLPRKNVQHLSSLLLMLITAHQHLDTHKQNQSGTRSQPKTFSYYKKTNKTATWLNTLSISPVTCRLVHIKTPSDFTRV